MPKHKKGKIKSSGETIIYSKTYCSSSTRTLRHAQGRTSRLSFDKLRIARRIAGIAIILLGFVLLSIQFTAQINTAAKEPIIADKAFEKESKESRIRGIIIPKLDIDISVMPSKINNGYWEVSEINASHGEGSANPGEKGNVVVFAHARDGLFLNLRNIKKDDEVYILTDDKKYKYIVSEITSVYPNDITTVAPTDSEILTLFTCSGFFDEKRLIVKAIPQNP